MMKILLPFLLLSGVALAESASEEAIILNQELQFLEDSARDLEVVKPRVTEAQAEDKSPGERSLERTYFSDSERDVIRTRTAAPRRVRSF